MLNLLICFYLYIRQGTSSSSLFLELTSAMPWWGMVKLYVWELAVIFCIKVLIIFRLLIRINKMWSAANLPPWFEAGKYPFGRKPCTAPQNLWFRVLEGNKQLYLTLWFLAFIVLPAVIVILRWICTCLFFLFCLCCFSHLCFIQGPSLQLALLLILLQRSYREENMMERLAFILFCGWMLYCRSYLNYSCFLHLDDSVLLFG